MKNYVIIDDETRSVEALHNIITNFSDYELKYMGAAHNIDEGFNLIKQTKPDLVFLDIEMPFGSGFNLLEKFEKINFQVIFTTGFDQYAITSIKFSALDYLLKPINITELKEAIARANTKIVEKSGSENLKVLLENLKLSKSTQNKIPLPSLTGLDMVSIDAIVHCQADEDYTHVFLKDGTKKVVTKSIKDFEEMLVPYGFFRVHHSFLINKVYIKKYTKGEGGSILTDFEAEIPVSRRRKAEFLQWLNEV